MVHGTIQDTGTTPGISPEADSPEVWSFFAHEDDCPELDVEACVGRLSAAIQCRTVSHVDTSLTDYGEFDRLHGLIRESYPHIMAAGTSETIGHSILITIPGTDPDLRPVQLMAHQDVVPVVPGTEDDWTHDAFSGFVDDTYVWGRGTLDIKEMLMGELEAVELVLARGGRLRRTLILAFGEDEETLQQGSRALARTLDERGVRLEFLLDEGSTGIDDGADFGAPGFRFRGVELGEKGYCDVRVTARSIGGHSSNPFVGTSLATVCEAVARIAAEAWPQGLSPLVASTFTELVPHVTEGPFATLLAPLPGETPEQTVARQAAAIAAACAERRELFPLAATTCAPTMLEGGSQGSNVMPQTVWAVVNFRLLPGVSSDWVMGRCRELVDGLDVELDWFQPPSEPSAADAGCASELGWDVVSEAVGRYFADPATGKPLPCVPALATGGTDAHMYEGICDSCLRMGPMAADAAESERGVHGTDERITRRAYLQGIRVLARIVERACL